MSWIVFFCSCLGAFCLIVGYLIGEARGRRHEQAEARGRRVARQFRRMRPPELHHEAIGLAARFLDPRVAEAALRRHEDEAMAVANGEDAVFLAGINERLDRWLADTFGTAP